MKRALEIYKAQLADATFKEQRIRVAKMADLINEFEKEIEAYRSADEVETSNEEEAKKNDLAYDFMDDAYDHFAKLYDLIDDAYRAIK